MPGARDPLKIKVALTPPTARSDFIPTESQVLRSVLALLWRHPAVAWSARMNSGGFKDKAGQYVRFGFVGCSDVIGQMRDGRFLAIEVKRPGGKPTGPQQAFIDRVNAANGVAFIARSIDDVNDELRKAA